MNKHIYYGGGLALAPAFRKAMDILKSGKVGKPL